MAGSERDFVGSCARWDGEHYQEIAEKGYFYDPGRSSTVAFFPLYPLSARCLSVGIGAPTNVSLLAVSHLALAASFIALSGYLRSGRLPSESGKANLTACQSYALVVLGVWPTTFFFRMAYSESLFLLLSILALWGMARRDKLWRVAMLVGLATATRPVGVALLLPLWSFAYRESPSIRVAIGRLGCATIVGCSGLLAYMGYQYLSFGDPLAFAKTQTHWRMRPFMTMDEKILALLSWEPIWSVYVPRAYGHWQSMHDGGIALFSLQFANPIYFTSTALLVAWGYRKGWINGDEFFFSFAALAIPYVTRSTEMCMASQGRFAAVVFPFYIIAGRILAGTSPAVAGAILALCGFLMGIYAALFAAGYTLI